MHITCLINVLSQNRILISYGYGCCREEFHGIVFSIEKIHRDTRQQIKGGSNHPSAKQLRQRVGIKPSLDDCLDGLMLLYDMHHSEYGTFLCIVFFYNHERR